MPSTLQQATTTHAFTRDSLTLTGNSRTCSCGVTVPFSWVLVHKVLLCPPSFCFPVLCKFWQSVVRLMVTSSKRTYAHTQSPRTCSRPLLTQTSQEMLKHSPVSVSVGSLGPGGHKVCLSPPRVSGGNGV